MFAELNELLGASVERPEQGTLTLLCADKTDASFLVHHFLSFYLKAGCKVCFVALVQSFSHYNIVAQKLGSSLTAAKERGQLVLLEGLKSANDFLFGQQPQSGEAHPFQFISGDGSNLKALYEFIRKALSPAADGDLWKFPVLMVDNLSVMLSLGVRPRDILDFIQYCRATVSTQLKVYEFNGMGATTEKALFLAISGLIWDDAGRDEQEVKPEVLLEMHNNPEGLLVYQNLTPPVRRETRISVQGNLVVMVQSDESSEDEQNDLLAKSLHHQSSWVLRAEGLASGFCKDVHGQLTIVQRSSWETKAERDLLRIFQYKIQDKNVTFFARGMSAAVL